MKHHGLIWFDQIDFILKVSQLDHFEGSFFGATKFEIFETSLYPPQQESDWDLLTFLVVALEFAN